MAQQQWREFNAHGISWDTSELIEDFDALSVGDYVVVPLYGNYRITQIDEQGDLWLEDSPFLPIVRCENNPLVYNLP